MSSTILKSTKATRWTLLTLTWVAFLLRILNLAGQSLWRDEVDAIRFSDWPLSELVTGLFRVGHNGPLFFLLLRFWRNLTGTSEFALRYPSALFGALAIPLGFVLARQLGLSRRAGLLLGLLLATSPYLVWYGQEAKMYSLLLVLVCIAFIAYLKAWWLIFVIATSLSFYTHILAPLMLPVYSLVALLHPIELRRHWRGWLISMASLTVPYLPLAFWQAPLLWADFQSGHPFYPLARQLGILLHLYSTGLLHFVGPTASLLFMFLFLSGLFLPGRTTANQTTADGSTELTEVRRPPTAENNPITPHFSLFTFHFSRLPPPASRLTLALWTLLPPLTVYLISLRVQVFEDRYLIYIVPGFYLIVILGLLAVWQYSRRLAALCMVLILAINLMAIWQQQRQPIKADFRAAAAYLSSQPQPTSPIMVQMPYLQYTLAYYYKGDYTLLEGLWTNDNKSEAEVDAQMTALTANLAGLWLVTSEEETWDRRHLTRGWLDAHANLVDHAHFTRVDVYHYRFQPSMIEAGSR